MAPPSRQPHFMTVESRIEPARGRHASFVLLPVSFLFFCGPAPGLISKIETRDSVTRGILNTSTKGS